MTGEGEVRDFWDPYLDEGQGCNVPQDDIDRMLRVQKHQDGEQSKVYTPTPTPKTQTLNPKTLPLNMSSAT